MPDVVEDLWIDSFAPPPMQDERVILREIIPSDYPVLYRMAMDPSLSHRWRFRNQQLLFEDFVHSLGEGVHSQFVITAKPGLDPIGVVTCYNAHPWNRIAYVAVLGAPPIIGSGLGLEAMGLFLDHLFGCFGFTKLYAEAPAFTFEAFKRGVGRYFHEEGRLRDHLEHGGRRWDQHILAVYRDEWLARQAGSLDRAAARAQLLPADGVPEEAFVAFLVDALDLDVPLDGLGSSTRLVDDLGLDSIGLVELLEVLADLGIPLEIDAALELETVGDLHFHVVQHRP